MRHVLARQGHGRAGLRIATHARRPVMQGKTAKTTDLDAFAIGEGVAHLLQQALDRQLHVVEGEVLLAFGERFDQFRLGHELSTLRTTDSFADSSLAQDAAKVKKHWGQKPNRNGGPRGDRRSQTRHRGPKPRPVLLTSSSALSATRPAWSCHRKRTGIPPAPTAVRPRPWRGSRAARCGPCDPCR